MSRNTAAAEVVGSIVLFVGTMAILFGTAAFNAWVLSHLWVWYITPIFGFMVPKLYLLYGLILTAAWFQRAESTGKSTSDTVIESLVKGFVILGFGWVVQAMFA